MGSEQFQDFCFDEVWDLFISFLVPFTQQSQQFGTRACHFASYLLHVGMITFHLHGVCYILECSPLILKGIFATCWHFKRSCGFLQGVIWGISRVALGFQSGFLQGFTQGFRVSLRFHLGCLQGSIQGFFRLSFRISFRVSLGFHAESFFRVSCRGFLYGFTQFHLGFLYGFIQGFFRVPLGFLQAFIQDFL